MELFGWNVPGHRYLDSCRECINDENKFNNFKNNPLYTGILEHATYDVGKVSIEFIDKMTDYTKEIQPYLNEYKENDIYGNTTKFLYERYGDISPTTLTYIYNYIKIKQKISDIDTVKNIVEIGGGYGGQCKIISSRIKFDSYTIFDLKEATELQSKYLNLLKVKNVDCLHPSIFNEFNNKEIDLIISTFAWSELTKEVQLFYFDNYIKKAKHGYFRCNLCYSGLTREEIINLFMSAGFKNLFVGQEEVSVQDNSTVMFIW
jgi:putative sugar O-methyltransferase